MADETQMNAPEARTETGAIVDQAPKVEATTSTASQTQPSTSETKPTTEAKPEVKPEGTSLLNEKDEEAVKGAPDAYTDFKVPDGMELDKAALEKASPLFKEMNLSQDQAQKLVDFYSEQAKAVATKPYDDYMATRKSWQDQVKADFGSQLPEVKATIGRALNLLPPETVKSFREAMDMTGAGDNPAFVKAFYELAKRSTEGRPVQGRGPADVNRAPGEASRPSAAQALFPKLPTSTVSP